MNAMQHQLNGESATNSQRGSPSPVLVGMLEQVPPDRRHTAQNSNGIRAVNRRKWSKDDNRIAMECFIRSKPENRGYRRRMINIWQDRGMFEKSEQRLADQVKQIKHNQWLTKVEVEEISRIISRTEAGDDAEEVQEEEQVVVAGELTRSQNADEVTGMGDQEGGGVEEGTEDASIELTAEELDIRKRIEEVMVSVKGTGKWSIHAMRQISRKKLASVSAMVSRILGTVSTTNLTEINDLVFAGVVVVAEKLGVKSSQSQHKDIKPWWKRRLEGQINELRKDLSRIEQMDRGAMKYSDMRNRLMKKYQVKGNGISIVNPFDPTGYLRSLSCTTLRSRGLQNEPGIVLQLVTNGFFSHQLKCLEIYFVWRPQLINIHAERVT